MGAMRPRPSSCRASMRRAHRAAARAGCRRSRRSGSRARPVRSSRRTAAATRARTGAGAGSCRRPTRTPRHASTGSSRDRRGGPQSSGVGDVAEPGLGQVVAVRRQAAPDGHVEARRAKAPSRATPRRSSSTVRPRAQPLHHVVLGQAAVVGAVAGDLVAGGGERRPARPAPPGRSRPPRTASPWASSPGPPGARAATARPPAPGTGGPRRHVVAEDRHAVVEVLDVDGHAHRTAAVAHAAPSSSA